MRNRLVRVTLLAGFAIGIPITPGAAQQQVDIAHRATSDIAVRLTGPFARLKVTGWKHDSVSVTGFMPKGFRLENVFSGEPGVPSRGAKMYIEGPPEVAAKAAMLELRVPMTARVWIKGGSAELEVAGVTGDLDLNMIGGTIVVNGKPRTLNVEAMDAKVTFNGSADWVRLKTAAGDILMNGPSADAGFNTVTGNITVGGGTFERARFESVSGNLAFNGDIARGASLLFDTNSGAIDLQLDPKSSVAIEAETLTGSIENLLTGRPPLAGRDGRGHEIGLEIGFGYGRIVVRSFKGNVRLNKR